MSCIISSNCLIQFQKPGSTTLQSKNTRAWYDMWPKIKFVPYYTYDN